MEQEIEQACKRIAENVGAILLKLQGQKGWPDRLLLYSGRVAFIEFKSPDEMPSPLQQHILIELTMKGYTATWISSISDFKRLLGNLIISKIKA
jgi:hypothetical protein